MIPRGNGVYELALNGSDLPSIAEWEHDAWVDIQFAANGSGGQPIAWSQTNRIATLALCPMQ
jgi:hypothetical protein